MVWPSWTAMELAILRSWMVGLSVVVWVATACGWSLTLLTSWDTSSSTRPLEFTRGVTFRITPVSR